MSRISQILRRLVFLFRRSRLEREMEEEVRFHLEMKIRENLEAGMSPEEARYDALRRFGNRTRVQEQSREIWITRWLEALGQDLRYAVRTMRRNPGFVAVAAITLALGIAVNMVAFTAYNGVALRPLPVKDPGSIVRVYRWYDGSVDFSFSYRHYSYYRDHNTVFSGLVADVMDRVLGVMPASDASAGGEAEVVWRRLVSGNYFAVLGVEAALGRALLPADDQASADPVAVLSDDFWWRRFGSGPGVVGRAVTLNGTRFT